MSLNFSTDTSTQLTYSSFGFATPQFDNFSTSNQLLITSTSSSNFTIGSSNILVNRILSEIKNTSNYVLNTQYTLQNNINTVSASSSNFTIGTSNILINRIISEISNTSNYVLLSSNQIMNKINVFYSTTGNDASYLLKTGGTMSGALINTSTTASDFKGIYIMHAARQSHLPYLPNGQFYFRAPVNIDNENDYLSFGSRIGDNFLRLYGDTFGFGINSGTLRYNVPVGSVHRFYHGATNTAWIDDTGRLKATTFEGSGASLINLNYNNIPNRLTFISPLSSNATNQVSIDLSAY
jgi:hypothetical protein